MQYVIVVNGKPQVGKSSFENLCKEVINGSHGETVIASSIDPIKKIARELGWNGEKSEKWRGNLSMLKKMWIDVCDGPTRYITDLILRDRYTRGTNDDLFYFVDIREADEIKKLKDVLANLGLLDIRTTTVLISRTEKNDIKYNNKSDDNVGKYSYDSVIENNGSIGDLRNEALKFLDGIISDSKTNN